MADILIVDDDENICAVFRRFVSEQGHTPLVASSGKEAIEIVRSAHPAVVVMDVRMGGMSGLEALAEIRRIDANVPVIIMTAYGTSQTSIEAVQLGAFEYLNKPLDLDVVGRVITQALEAQALSRASTAPPPDASEYPLVNLVGSSAAMQDAYKRIGLLTTNDVPALIVGERGVGKRLVAKTIHFNSARRNGPFMSVSCGASDDESLGRDIFGDGGETPAIGGTLFLDGVEALPPRVQQRLLRTILDGTSGRFGSQAPPATARIVAASEVNLADEVRQGTFIAELHDALSVITIDLPPLRERRGDIPELVEHFLRWYSAELGKPLHGVDERVLQRLEGYQWPGNVAELQIAMQRACVLARGAVLTPDDLRGSLQDTTVPGRVEALAVLESAVRKIFHQRTSEPSGGASRSIFYDVIGRVEEMLIREALHVTGGNQVRAAEILDLNRSTLRTKIRLYDL